MQSRRRTLIDTPVSFVYRFVRTRGNYGRYEVGRFFGAVERLKRAAEEQNNREAQTAFAAMSVAYDRYLKVGMHDGTRALTRQHLSCFHSFWTTFEALFFNEFP